MQRCETTSPLTLPHPAAVCTGAGRLVSSVHRGQGSAAGAGGVVRQHQLWHGQGRGAAAPDEGGCAAVPHPPPCAQVQGPPEAVAVMKVGALGQADGAGAGPRDPPPCSRKRKRRAAGVAGQGGVAALAHRPLRVQQGALRAGSPRVCRVRGAAGRWQLAVDPPAPSLCLCACSSSSCNKAAPRIQRATGRAASSRALGQSRPVPHPLAVVADGLRCGQSFAQCPCCEQWKHWFLLPVGDGWGCCSCSASSESLDCTRRGAMAGPLVMLLRCPFKRREEWQGARDACGPHPPPPPPPHCRPAGSIVARACTHKQAAKSAKTIQRGVKGGAGRQAVTLIKFETHAHDTRKRGGGWSGGGGARGSKEAVRAGSSIPGVHHKRFDHHVHLVCHLAPPPLVGAGD